MKTTAFAAEIGGQSIYDMFTDKGDDPFYESTEIVKNIGASFYNLVMYVAVFILVVGLIIAAIGLTRSNAVGRDLAKKKLGTIIVASILVFSSVAIMSFSRSITEQLASGMRLDTVTSRGASLKKTSKNHVYFSGVRIDYIAHVMSNSDVYGLYPDLRGRYSHKDILLCLSRNECLSMLSSTESARAIAYADAYMYARSGKDIMDGSNVYTEWQSYYSVENGQIIAKK